MHDFTLPSNIKQIGSIGSGLRIYMEDYVCTFLHQYATAGGYEERIAYLVGRNMLIDGQSFLFISGAIYGMYAEKVEGYMRFSHKSAEYAETMLEEHFPGLEIVGWMQSQPSYGTYLNQHYGSYHLRQFTKPYQVLFVTDPLERANAFYAANPRAITPADRLKDLGGYFVYYEKNINMHEYMLTNKSIDYTAKPPTFVELKPDDGFRELTELEEPETFEAYDTEYDAEYDDTPPEEIIRRHAASRAIRRSAKAEQRRPSGLLASLCAVLFVVSFVMGVGLIRNQDRIDRMENEIRQLVTAHRNLFAQMSNPDIAPAFAEAPPTTEPSPYIPAQPPAGQSEPPPATPPAPPPYVPPTSTAPAYVEQEALIPAIPLTYTIQPGDSLIGISLMFFGDAGMVNEILALNGIENPDLIVAGRTIALPQR